ncbi:TetR/AcrR family transcriptional regulator [Nakamurella lactea]|uniref:TetR/AcrR family transcriptional regulator n=1 Tax=Nakamurella lactea TaxID=459515 RepID=UPI000400031E|nr:TetR/AcrR family transcriptional regulator [Nakamurella lactea]
MVRSTTTAEQSQADQQSVEGQQPVVTPVGAEGCRPMRADARRNREAVLTAAASAFAENGVESPLEDIARQAGVGIGTLYRHFPTREELVFGVYQREVAQLCESATALVDELPPAEALQEWMRRFVLYAATKRGLVGMLRTMMADRTDLFAETRVRIRDAANLLLTSAAAAGEIRDDITAEDLTRSIGGICMASDGPVWSPANAGRLVDLVFDGLRFGAPNKR